MSLQCYSVSTIAPPAFPPLWDNDCVISGPNPSHFWGINTSVISGPCPLYKPPVDSNNMALLAAAISGGNNVFIDCGTLTTQTLEFAIC